MQRWGFLENPPPAAALRWIATFLQAYGGELANVEDAFVPVSELRAEACVIPALELERLRSREVLFFLDSVSQYVDAQPELRGVPVEADIGEIAKEFGIDPGTALDAVRMGLSGKATGPALPLLFVLLGHDRIMMRIGAVNSHLLHGRGLEPIKYGPDGKPFEPIRATKPVDDRPSETSA